MTFLWPTGLLALALVALGVLAARRIDERRRQRVAGLSGLGGLAGAGSPSSVGGVARAGARLTAVLVVVAFVLFAVALARPRATVSLPRVEGTVVLTFDVSASMAADDVAPNRMEVAKTAARTIVEAQPPGVVVGIVAFSDAGLSVQPPTADRIAIHQAIDRLAPSRGTSVGQGILAGLGAIDQAERDVPAGYYSNRSALPEAPSPVAAGSHGSAAIVFLSDGENLARPDPIDAARTAADRGIRIVTVGVGTADGATLDLDGFRVQTRLDEATLRTVAELTAGSYTAVDELTPAMVYDGLGRSLVARDEAIELTALVAGLGLLLLVAASVVSILRTGRLP
jgi:Ca-activated chloride channel family protein